MSDFNITMTATTPMATPDTMPWLSSMVVTIFVKQPSNAYLRFFYIWVKQTGSGIKVLLSFSVLRVV